MIDLRQSGNWAQYLNWLGWKSIKTKNNTYIYIRKTPFGSVSKIQRPKSLTDSDLKAVDLVCKENKVLFVKIEPNLKQNLNILEKHNYQISHSPYLPPSTIHIDLTKSKEKLWDSISRSGKYSIRRAQREGGVVEHYTSPGEGPLEEFNKIAQETSKKKRFFVNNLKDLKKKVEVFKNNSHLLLVRNGEGNLMGGTFYLSFNKNVWLLHGGTSNEGRKGRWGYELYWQSFLYFKKLGYETLDLEGKDDDRFPTFTKDWGGFSHFKEKFGGYVVKYPYPHIKIYNPILKKLQKMYGVIPL